MLTCRDATALASRAMDAPLPWRQRLSLRMHLAMCRYCTRYQRQLRFIRLAVATLEPIDAGKESLGEGTKDAIRKRISEAKTSR